MHLSLSRSLHVCIGIGRECNVHRALMAHNDEVNDTAAQRSEEQELDGMERCVCIANSSIWLMLVV